MKRIQRKRTKGWRMPANTVYVGRPTIWGNPHKDEDKALAVEKFEHSIEQGHHDDWVHDNFEPEGHCHDDYKVMVKKHLKGKNLACWCRTDQPCHADVLLKIANE